MGAESQSARSKVIGLRSSAGPLDSVAITFGEGVTALYGRNGAGKTWILNALRQSFGGRAASGTHIVVTAPDRSDRLKWLEQVLDERSLNERWPHDDFPHGETPRGLTAAIQRWFEEVGRNFQQWERLDTPPDFITELARSRYLALVPTGISDQRWDVWICSDPQSTDSPTIDAELRLFERVERTTSALLDTLNDITEIPEDSPDLGDSISRLEGQLAEFQEATNGESVLSWHDDLSDFLAYLRAFSPDQDLGELCDKAYECGYFAPFNWLAMPAATWAWQNEPLRSTSGDFSTESGGSLRKMLSDGLPIPLARVAQVDKIPWVLHDEAANEKVDILTAHGFALAMASAQNFTDNKTISITPFMEEWIESLTSDANAILIGLLQDGPELTLSLAPPHEWVISDPLHWTASRGEVSVAISELSTAERRWAQVAIRRALDRTPRDEYDALGFPRYFWPPFSMRRQPADLIVIDEPETALHRAAERHMAHGLDGLTVSGPQVVAATHSPDVLNQPEACLVHVRRTPEGSTSVNQMVDVDLEASVSDLGMLPSDLIGLYRVFLLVEGEHDKIVVEALLSEVLETARVKIVPMRGGKHLPSTIESQLLFDMTGAHMVALLDNIKATEIETVWNEAQERYLTGDADTAITYLTAAFKDRKGDEYKWITTWLSRALTKGVFERLSPYSLAAADIIEYLPVQILVPRAKKSWPELREEFEAQNHRNFKDWLQRRYKADTSVQNVARAAAAVMDVPEEFQRLGYRLREIGSRRT